ncbi:MAG: hypothetical protein V3V62_12285 [bacterium]
MTYPQAIVVSAAIIGGSFILANMGESVPGRAAPGAQRYQIAATPGQTVANAWRLDLESGEMYRCFAVGGMYGAICRKARFLELENSVPDSPDLPKPNSTGYSGIGRPARWSR